MLTGIFVLRMSWARDSTWQGAGGVEQGSGAAGEGLCQRMPLLSTEASPKTSFAPAQQPSPPRPAARLLAVLQVAGLGVQPRAWELLLQVPGGWGSVGPQCVVE
jgi:hypothetical protein